MSLPTGGFDRVHGEGGRGDESIDSIALGLMALALCGLSLSLLIVPQRIAQRTARHGVISLRVDSAGQMRVWNQPIRPQDLPDLLRRASHRSDVRLRLVPDAALPWGTVQQLVGRLEASGLPLELQLP
jgi:hypothetical protein